MHGALPKAPEVEGGLDHNLFRLRQGDKVRVEAQVVHRHGAPHHIRQFARVFAVPQHLLLGLDRRHGGCPRRTRACGLLRLGHRAELGLPASAARSAAPPPALQTPRPHPAPSSGQALITHTEQWWVGPRIRLGIAVSGVPDGRPTRRHGRGRCPTPASASVQSTTPAPAADAAPRHLRRPSVLRTAHEQLGRREREKGRQMIPHPQEN